MPVQVIRLQGSARERGRQLGEALRNRIRSIYERNEDRDAQSSTTTPATEWDDPERVQATIAYMASECPRLLEEVRGLAEGVNLGPGQVLRTQLYPRWAALEIREGCTEAAAITSDAGPVMFQTGDAALTPGLMEQLQQADLLVQQVVPDEGPRFLTVGYVNTPLLGYGINEEGLARIGALGQSPKRSVLCQTGLPYLLCDRHLLHEARDADDATELLRRLIYVGRAKAMILVDARGTMRCVEKWQHRTGVREAEGNSIYQANDFVTPEMADLADHNQNTQDRHRELARLFAQAAAQDDLTLERMWSLLQHHAPEQGSICRHGEAGPRDDGAISALALLARCRDRELYYTWGHTPCEGKFAKLTMDF